MAEAATGMDWTGDAVDRVRVTVPDRAALLDDLGQRLAAGQGFTVATLNLDHVVKLGADPAFRQAYAAQSHVTADGNPIVWLEHLAGRDSVQLVPGSELVEPVVALAAGAGVPVGLFGATETSLTAAAEALRARHPGLEIAFLEAPAMGFDPDGPEADAAIGRIGDSGVRVVFLALGAPKQERFAARAAERLQSVGFLSVGAGLDFLSGAQTRAPEAVRGLAMEWAWRMAGNPRRLAGRYARCAVALPGLALRAARIRGQGREQGGT